MRLSGWIFMAISWFTILGLAAYCFSQIFRKGLGAGRREKKDGS